MPAAFTPLIPRQPVPPLRVSLVGGGTFDLLANHPERFTLVVFYRGLHCPVCKAYVTDLHSKVDEFLRRGVFPVAVSSDNQERASQAVSQWDLSGLSVGYGLPLEVARSWGLFLSAGQGKTSTGVEEPERFSEPGLFLVRPDGTLYFSAVQTMPFARPRFADILGAVDYVIAKDYPARGELPPT